MDKRIRKIVVVGGGTAGWLAAAYMIRALKRSGVEDPAVTLVESAEIGILGVGEATIPDLKQPLQFLGIDEKTFMKRTNATFKNAIKFVNWREDPKKVGEEVFYHPFDQPANKINGVMLWDVWAMGREQGLQLDFAYMAGMSPSLCDNNRAPKTPNSKPWQGSVNYAYHLDAVLLGRYLKEVSIDRGVHHVIDNVVDVTLDDRGFVQAVETKENGRLDGDLFIDCSGFRGLIINKVYNSKFIDYTDSLFCDRAVTLRTPYTGKYSQINCFTTSTAVNAGWIWEIHLHGKNSGEETGRRGIGYVYSSKFISDEDAEVELRNYIGSAADGLDARFLKMRVGRNETPWVKNCVSIGLSGGFIEPLESTGISLITAGLELLLQNFPTKEFPGALIDSYNDAMGRLYEHIREFIVLHYCLTQREDTEFWRANKHNKAIPERLKEKLEYWRYRPPKLNDNDSGFQFFRDYSYQCILAGMKYLPEKEDYSRFRLPNKVLEKYVSHLKIKEKEILLECPDHLVGLGLIHG